jgi:hypothetical protein
VDNHFGQAAEFRTDVFIPADPHDPWNYQQIALTPYRSHMPVIDFNRKTGFVNTGLNAQIHDSPVSLFRFNDVGAQAVKKGLKERVVFAV